MRLLESSQVKKKKSVGGTIFSVVFHGTILFLVIYATARANDAPPEMKSQNINFVKTVKVAPEPPKTRPARLLSDAKLAKVAIPAPALGFKTLPTPVEIPTSIPDIDPTAKIINEADFTGKGVAGGIGNGVKGSAGAAGSSGTIGGSDVYTEDDVDEVVVSMNNAAPIYPEAMRAAGIEGHVLAEFVVTEKGSVDRSTIRIIESTNPLFEASVRSVIPRMRFKPAKFGGRIVKQLVRQPFQFQLNN